MIKKTHDLAEELIFNYLLDAKCSSSTEFERALNTLRTKVREAQEKLLSSKQLYFDID